MTSETQWEWLPCLSDICHPIRSNSNKMSASSHEGPPADNETPSAVELIAHLQYGLGEQIRPRLDDQLVVELARVAEQVDATANDAVRAVARAAHTTTAGRPVVLATDDAEATAWLAVLRSDLEAVLAVTPAGPDRHLPLFDTAYRRLADLAADAATGHDPQRVWMRFHAALGRVAPQGS